MAFDNNLALSITLGTKGGLQQALAEFAKLTQAEKDVAIAAQNSAREQIAQQRRVQEYLSTLSKERRQLYLEAFKEQAVAERNYTQLIAEENKRRAQAEKEFQKGRLLFLKEYQAEAAAIAKQTAEQQANPSGDTGGSGLPGIGQAALLGLAIRQSADVVRDLVDVSAKYEVLGKRLEFVAGSSAKAAYEQSKLRDLANKYGFEQDKLIDGYATLATRLREVGLSTSQLDGLYENLTISAKAQSISTEAYNGAITQLAQGLSTGALRGDEYRSVTEAGIITTGAFAKALGISTDQVKSFAEQNKLTTDIVLKAAQITRDEFGGAAEAASKTAVSSFARMGNALDDLKVAIGKFTLNPVAEGVDAATKEVKKFSDAVEALANNSGNTPKDLPWWAVFLPGAVGATAGVVESQKSAADALTEQAVDAARNIAASLQGDPDKPDAGPKVKLSDLEKKYATQTDAAKGALADQQANLQEALNDQRLSQSDYQSYVLELNQESSRKQIDILQQQSAAFKAARLADGITEEERAKKIADTELKIKELRLKSTQETYSEVERLAKESQQRIADAQTDSKGTNSNRIAVLNGELNLIKQGQSFSEKQIQNEIALAQMRGQSGKVEELKLKLFDEQTRSLLEQTKIQSEINRLNTESARIQNEITISSNNAEIAKRIARDGAKADIKALVDQQILLQEANRNLGKISELNAKSAKFAEQELIVGRLKAAQTKEQYAGALKEYEQDLRNQNLSEAAIKSALAAVEEMARAQEKVTDAANKTADGYERAAGQAGRLADNLGKAAEESDKMASKNASSGKYEGRAGGLSDVDPNRPYASRSDARYNATNSTQSASDAAANRYQQAADRAFAKGTALPTFGDISTYNEPKIPQAAEGAYVKNRPGGTLINVGEARHDEVILPLNERGAAMMANVLQQFNAVPQVNLNQDPVVKAITAQTELLSKVADKPGRIEQNFYQGDSSAMNDLASRYRATGQ